MLFEKPTRLICETIPGCLRARSGQRDGRPALRPTDVNLTGWD